VEHTKHIWRAVILLLAFAVLAVIGRHFLVPETFGEHGFYRYASLAEFMSKPLVHGGAESCTPCHQEIASAKQTGKHASVSCEVCHAPLAVHASGEEKIADMPVDRSVRLCSTCHLRLIARPETMPQIDLHEHLELERSEPVPDMVCGLCHPPHAPQVE